MLRTTTVTHLQAKLTSLLESLGEGPVLVLSHSKPVAMLIDPAEFDGLLERIRYLEDLLEGRQAVAEYLANPAVALNAEEVFGRLGQ